VHGSRAAAFGFRVEGIAPTPWLAVVGGESLPLLDARNAPGEGADLVQPGVAHVALPELRALGRVALHAAAIVVDGVAWALIGTRKTGKSTLAYACHRAGVTILTEDVLVLEGLRAFAGPRCLDLRIAVEGADVVRDERHRVTLPPAPAEAPLAGVVYLRWEDEARPALRPLDPGERLKRLADGTRGDAPWRGDVELLEVAALPGYELCRSQSGRVEDAAALLLAELPMMSSP
jgi:hypothetical protein